MVVFCREAKFFQCIGASLLATITGTDVRVGVAEVVVVGVDASETVVRRIVRVVVGVAATVNAVERIGIDIGSTGKTCIHNLSIRDKSNSGPVLL